MDNTVKMNLLAGTTDNSEAFGEAFNIAAGGIKTLNELYALINQELKNHIEGHTENKATFRDFRAGDICHSNADISKAKAYVGYEPTHDIYKGIQEAIGWYVESLRNCSI